MVADVPAIDQKDIEFKINYISPLGSFATWKSTKQTGSYDLRTFEIHALPVEKVEGLRPGMSVLLSTPLILSRLVETKHAPSLQLNNLLSLC